MTRAQVVWSENKSRLFPIVPLAILLTFLPDRADNKRIVG